MLFTSNAHFRRGIPVTEFTVYETYTREIENIGWLIEQKCDEALLPYAEGLYSRAELEPVMTPDLAYYTNTPSGRMQVRIEDIPHVDSRVYTYAGKDERVVIPASFLGKHHAHYLSKKPFLPYRGIKIIETLVRDQLSKSVKYRGPHFDVDVDEIYRHFDLEKVMGVPGYDDDEPVRRDRIDDVVYTKLDPYICAINSYYEPIYEDIKAFVRKFEWHLYFLSVRRNALRIEKSIDWRAHQYLRMINEDEHRNSKD